MHNTEVGLPDWRLTGGLPYWRTDFPDWRLTGWMTQPSTIWLSIWLTGCLAVWLIDQLSDRTTDWLTNWLTDWLPSDWRTGWLTNLPTKGLTCSLTAVRTNVDWLPTDRPVVYIYIYIYIYIYMTSWTLLCNWITNINMNWRWSTVYKANRVTSFLTQDKKLRENICS